MSDATIEKLPSKKDLFCPNLPLYVERRFNQNNHQHLAQVYKFLFGSAFVNYRNRHDESGQISIAAKSIAIRLNENPRKIRRHLVDLTKFGYIEVISPPKRNKATVYFIPLLIEYIYELKSKAAIKVGNVEQIAQNRPLLPTPSNQTDSSMRVTHDPHTAIGSSIDDVDKGVMRVTHDPHTAIGSSMRVTHDPIYIYNYNYIKLTPMDEKMLLKRILISFKKVRESFDDGTILRVIDWISFKKNLLPSNDEVLRMANTEHFFIQALSEIQDKEKAMKKRNADYERVERLRQEQDESKKNISEEMPVESEKLLKELYRNLRVIK